MRSSKKFLRIKSHQITKRKSKSIAIAHLPDEILLDIFGMLSLDDKWNAKRTCKRFNNIYKQFIQSEYRKILKEVTSPKQKDYKKFVLQVLNASTQAFVGIGRLDSLYHQLAFDWLSYNDSKSFMYSELIYLLQQFYKMAELYMNTFELKQAFVATLVILVKFFRSTVLKQKKRDANTLSLSYTVPNKWLAVIWTVPICSHINYDEDSRTLLTILSVLLTSDRWDKKHSIVFSDATKVFVFGNEHSEVSTNRCSIDFDIVLNANPTILDQFEDVSTNGACQWTSLDGDFYASIQIHCKEARKWGSWQSHEINV